MKILVSAFLLLWFAPVLQANDDIGKRETYITDFATDRRPASTAFPDYPAVARRDRIEGEATVCFRINARGKVKRASVKEYSHKIFRRPALRAVRRSTFEPLLPGELLLKAKACRTYRFRLEPIVVDNDT